MLVCATVLLAGCSDPGDPVEAEPELATVPTTTAFEVALLEVSGLEYCEVADQVGSSLQVYWDLVANLGEPESVRDVYAGALRGFDALAQVASREVQDDLGLLARTLNDAVDAAAQVGWDLTVVTADAGTGADAAVVSEAFGKVRQYTRERCGVDVGSFEPPITTGPDETPTARLLRVISETFPSMPSASVACLASRLPFEWDPEDPDFDADQLRSAMRRCGVDPNSPSTPTTVRDEDSDDSTDGQSDATDDTGDSTPTVRGPSDDPRDGIPPDTGP
jgi:hypothetical protein